MAISVRHVTLLALFLAAATATNSTLNQTDANGRPIIRILGIEPDAGPLTGNTRVIVRGNFYGFEDDYPDPHCRFGHDDLIVPGVYIKCAPRPRQVGEPEPKTKDKNDTCVQCDNSPTGLHAEVIPFSVSLVGDFSDSADSVAYRYYVPTKIHAIYPRYGPKDGNTTVEVWGENFLNFDETLRCGFGSRETPGIYVSPTYMICQSPKSDVIGKALPFSISLNNQQNSKDYIDFWYYSQLSIAVLLPDRGPDTGGTKIVMKGNNFNPFKDEPIDNLNDTFCRFQELGKVKATPLNSTKMAVTSPPSYILTQAEVECTLNNQQYSDDGNIFYYYKPPAVYDIQPREGPTSGNTTVYAIGSNFRDTGTIQCKFGNKVVPGKFVSQSKIACVSPPVEKPGYVPLAIALEQELFSSADTVKFLYYEPPVIDYIEPLCGPVYGFTQVSVYGKNFIDMGYDKVKCIFNRTIYTNATIMEPDIIKCDSPPLEQSTSSGDEAPFYFLEITINGKEISGPKAKFTYYLDPLIKVTSPNLGPMKGNTTVRFTSHGFNQTGACNVTARYGAFQVKPTSYNDTDMYTLSPRAFEPDDVVVSVALNGQQFSHDKILHVRDIENTYTYYEEPYVAGFKPHSGPATGKTFVQVWGKGFTPFKDENGDTVIRPLYLRLVNTANNESISEPLEITDMKDNLFNFYTPPSEPEVVCILQISFNKVDWQTINFTTNSTYTYYQGPQITDIQPRYGPVKAQTDQIIDITGTNFNCPEPTCSELYVRFGNSELDFQYFKGTWISTTHVKCKVPRYSKPDVLRVELTLNNQDYTNDNFTYGYFDPYILNVWPKLLHKTGSTKVHIYGFGFVDTTGSDLKSLYNAPNQTLLCSAMACNQMATFIDKRNIETTSFPQSVVEYKDSGLNIGSDPMIVEATVYGGTYTDQKHELYYYDDPTYGQPEPNGAPANGDIYIFTPADFKFKKNNDQDRFIKYSNFTCRFTSADGSQVVYTEGEMASYPLDQHMVNETYTSVACRSPKWKLDKNAKKEHITMDISVNGIDYIGGFSFTIYEPLQLLRIMPMSGPVDGGTSVKCLGTGFNITNAHINLELMNKIAVRDYTFTEEAWSQVLNGAQIWQAYTKETYSIEKVDAVINEGEVYRSYVTKSPKLPNMHKTHGGPIYWEVGVQVKLEAENSTLIKSYMAENNITNATLASQKSNASYDYTLYSYARTMVEFYYYKQPVVKKMSPHGGVTTGGTPIEISGAWFSYRPEYGVVPHCKIGDYIVRAKFIDTVRIICESPPNNNTAVNFPLEISQNGVDFVDSGFKYHYYVQPELTGIYPDCGPESGGTQIHIMGTHFTNLSSPSEFNCKFSAVHLDVPPKFIPAVYENETTIMCSSPGGWGKGDEVNVQVTFNGKDYSGDNFTFYFYNVIKAFPRSGPADGKGGVITIIGNGFKNGTEIICMMDQVLMPPVEVTLNGIVCPMPPSKHGPKFFGNVEFAVIINGNWHKFTGGFQYYEQIDLEDMYPRMGPFEGQGKIHFYGKNIRSDFNLAELGCRLGTAVGKGTFVSMTEMICVVEEMPLVGENETLPAAIALNSYSWTPANDSMFYIPYGITGIYPNCGPSAGGTEILVQGKGFLNSTGKCRFGVQGNYAIVEAQVLTYDKMICRSPQEFHPPPTGAYPHSVQFSISFQEEEFEPWTESMHRFRFYDQPALSRAEPDEAYLGSTTEVFVFADSSSEFIEPIPYNAKSQSGEFSITCRFGRFGQTQGIWMNSSVIKCFTPTNNDEIDSIYKEGVLLSISQNGQDFDEDNTNTDFTMKGNATYMAFWPWIIGTLLVGALAVSLAMMIFSLINKCLAGVGKSSSVRYGENPHVVRDEAGVHPRGLPSNFFVDNGRSSALSGSGDEQYQAHPFGR